MIIGPIHRGQRVQLLWFLFLRKTQHQKTTTISPCLIQCNRIHPSIRLLWVKLWTRHQLITQRQTIYNPQFPWASFFTSYHCVYLLLGHNVGKLFCGNSTYIGIVTFWKNCLNPQTLQHQENNPKTILDREIIWPMLFQSCVVLWGEKVLQTSVNQLLWSQTDEEFPWQTSPQQGLAAFLLFSFFLDKFYFWVLLTVCVFLPVSTMLWEEK